jgi:GNAT superfamily N-acetyltransferase
MTILPLSHRDLGALGELQPEGWPDILPFMDFYTQSLFCFPHKVVIDNRIAGIGTGIVHGQTGWLGHIIVSPKHRNQGLGRIITQTLIDTLHNKGCTTLYLVATVFGESVYLKTGFETETEYLFFKDISRHQHLPDDQIVTFRSEHLGQLAVLDRELSGEERMMEIERCVEDGYVYLAGRTLEGFYLPALGEGLIVAATPTAGLALMKLRLSNHDNAVFPVDNLHASQHLYTQGYKEFRRARRMRLGEKRPWQPAALYNRIAGNIG